MRSMVRFIPTMFIVCIAYLVPFGAHAVTCSDGVYCDSISTNTSGTRVTSIAAGSTGNKVYTAKWTPETYTYTYSGEGTSNLGCSVGGGADDCTYTIEDEVTLSKPMDRTGYTFVGWYDNEQFNNEPITKIAKGTTGNKTFYAKWVATKFSVTLIANGGTTKDPVPTECTYGTPCVLPKYDKPGYEFAGWQCS